MIREHRIDDVIRAINIMNDEVQLSGREWEKLRKTEPDGDLTDSIEHRRYVEGCTAINALRRYIRLIA